MRTRFVTFWQACWAGGSHSTGGPMLNLDQFMNIRFLQKQGHSARQIARLTGHSRNTVRKLLRAQTAPAPKPASAQASSTPIATIWSIAGRRTIFLQCGFSPRYRRASPARSKSCAASSPPLRRSTAWTRA